VIAGGSGAIPGLMADRGLHSLILAFHAFGKPIMGECNGGLALAQTIDPKSGKSILQGRAVTTHSWLDNIKVAGAGFASFPKIRMFTGETESSTSKHIRQRKNGSIP